MTTAYRVALLGFSDFERSTLASCFRLATRREPAYLLVETAAQAQFLVADAEHAATVLDVTAAGRVDDTVFIGNRPPPGATAWMLRPIDPVHVMRELDAMAALQQMEAARAPPDAPRMTTPAPPPEAGAQDLPDVPGMPEAPHARPPALPARARATLGTWPPSPAPFPARRVVREPVLPQPPAPTADAAAIPQALLVDDSEIACAYLARRLQDWGVQCTTAPNSARALERLARQRFDLVFMDVELGPGSALDGLALCQRLRRQHPAHGAGSPLLAMVSAHHRELDRARGTLAGADAYLGKPLDDAELAQVLRRHGISPRSGAAR